MSDVSKWSATDASNNSAPPAGAPEGHAPSAANDIMRAMMGAIARWFADLDGSLLSAGTSTAYTLAANNTVAALTDQSAFCFRVHVTNTGACTLAVDGLVAKSIRAGGTAVLANALLIDTLVVLTYNPNDDAYDLIGGYIAGVADGGTGAITAAGARTSLGLVLGTDVQAWDADLDAIAALSHSDGEIMVSDGAAWVLESGATARASLGVDDEFVEDIVGTMVTGNTETGIVVTYQDGDGTLDFVLDLSGLTGMTVAPVGTDGFLIDDGGVSKRMSYNQTRFPSINDSNARTFASTDVGVVLAYTGSGGHNWTMNSGVGHDEAPIMIVNRGTGNMTLVSGTATLETAGPGLVMPPKSMAFLMRESSNLWQVGGTGLIA